MDNDFGNHTIVVRWNRIARIDCRIHAQANPSTWKVEIGDLSWTWCKVKGRIFRIDPAFNGMTGNLDIFLTHRQFLAFSNLNLLFHDINSSDKFCHGMLNLNPSIHLHEVKFAFTFIVKKLDCPSIFIANRFCRADSCRSDLVSNCLTDCYGWRFFEDFLVVSLKGTIPFTQMNHMSKLVSQNLNLNMTSWVDDAFKVHSSIAKGRLSFCRSRFKSWN